MNRIENKARATLAALVSSVLLIGPAAGQAPSPLPADGFAVSIANATDLNGDGLDDVLVGDPDPASSGDARGGVWVLSGRDLAAIRHIQPAGASAWFGSAVACIGSAEKGGERRFVVATVTNYSWYSLRAHENDTCAGKVQLVSASGSILGELSGVSPGARFGQCVAGAGDIDGDGVDDFAVSAPGDRTVQGGRGAVRIYSGKDLKRLVELRGEHECFDLGHTLLVTSPSKLDGRRLVCCGARQMLDISSGCVRVFSVGKDARWLYTLRGHDREGGFGTALAEIADMDDDGWPEIAVGSPDGMRHDDDAPGNGGRILIVSGHTGAILREILAPARRRYFGSALVQGSEVDVNGRGELIALTSEPPESSAGTRHFFGFSLADGSIVAHEGTSGGQEIVLLNAKRSRGRFVVANGFASEGEDTGWVSLVDEVGRTACTRARKQLLDSAQLK